MPSPVAEKTATLRSRGAAVRRTAIVNAALDEFIEKGFAAARIEDIARRASVAKGTIYLHFNDKEQLFEAIVKQEIRPKIDAAAAIAASGGSLRDFIEGTLLPVLDEMAHTKRGAVIRLLIGEAGRFPKLAEVYYRVVIEPGLSAIRMLVRRAKQHGELTGDLFLEFPQLLVAPLLLAVIWKGLFERFHSLDVNRMAHGYFEGVLQKKHANQSKSIKKGR
ncbi:MAG: TetR/AcrR family transcriptional regulator [Acidobacteriaceae bacterium]|nr:TetR/AcrR family transcriptional regulator [Acidobacteriaceae bacterium]